jgi:hypothetical protein
MGSPDNRPRSPVGSAAPWETLAFRRPRSRRTTTCLRQVPKLPGPRSPRPRDTARPCHGDRRDGAAPDSPANELLLQARASRSAGVSPAKVSAGGVPSYDRRNNNAAGVYVCSPARRRRSNAEAGRPRSHSRSLTSRPSFRKFLL